MRTMSYVTMMSEESAVDAKATTPLCRPGRKSTSGVIGDTSPVPNGKRRVVFLTSQTDEQGLRRIREEHRVGLFETNIERFKQLPHRIEAIIIEQRSHPLPQQPLAAKLCPHSPKQGTAELLRLIHQKRQHYQHGNHHREILL